MKRHKHSVTQVQVVETYRKQYGEASCSFTCALCGRDIKMPTLTELMQQRMDRMYFLYSGPPVVIPRRVKFFTQVTYFNPQDPRLNTLK